MDAKGLRVDAAHQTGQSNCSRSLITKKLIFAQLLCGEGSIQVKSAHKSTPCPWTLIRHLLIPWLGCASAEGKCDPPHHHERPRIAGHSLPVHCSLLRSHYSIMVATRERNMNKGIYLTLLRQKKSGPKAALLNSAMSLTLADSSLL